MQPRLIVAGVVCALVAPSLATPVEGDYFDGPDCDFHGPRIAVDELGTVIFPPDELIDASFTPWQEPACPVTDDPAFPNVLVHMTNLTPFVWDDLFYVADPETSFTNVDGFAFSATVPGATTPAFRIDSIGANRPLIGESLIANGLFEPGETWDFIIQDYTNSLGLAPSALSSFDFAFGSLGDSHSSGSIVQFRVPAPGATALLALGAVGVSRRRR